MKVNGIELLQMIKEEKIKSNTEIKVWFNYRIKEYITTLWFDGIDLNWQPTTFYARYFYNKYIEFEIIEEEKEIEEIIILTDDANMKCVANKEYRKLSYSQVDLLFANKFNEIIKEVNKLKKEGK